MYLNEGLQKKGWWRLMLKIPLRVLLTTEVSCDSVSHYPQGNKNLRITVICQVCSFRQLTNYWILIDSSFVLTMEHLQLSAEVDPTGNIRKRSYKCRGKSLAVILWHPSRPTISKQEAITISSTFIARPLPLSLLFMSPFFFVLFSSSISHFHSIFITLLHPWVFCPSLGWQ